MHNQGCEGEGCKGRKEEKGERFWEARIKSCKDVEENSCKDVVKVKEEKEEKPMRKGSKWDGMGYTASSDEK